MEVERDMCYTAFLENIELVSDGAGDENFMSVADEVGPE
jgi:hypothetical protein